MENKLKFYRNKHSYSQEELAIKLSVSRQTILSIEKGRYNPSLPLALIIAKTFNTSVESIFSLDEKELKDFFNK
ncbi:putative transcriptional regulator [Virgibacillus natechei]|uniref:Transcriptional regulator n=1 Tax=Virgibacillus natechei TaxID=1216297 RepID=A0ABS4ICH4_9BACI|nr:helix-turn-helix transcriptional regulator [Virgibacillus natechei]MBP1968345.1 putative transcriptional regulator [Virgibacillus natechei]UZD13478.1 helix-turn-helix transcriptional regulator [Virgibacillus natechei]